MRFPRSAIHSDKYRAASSMSHDKMAADFRAYMIEGTTTTGRDSFWMLFTSQSMAKPAFLNDSTG